MDIITHSLWGLIVFHKLKLWWLVVLFSILPDVLPFIVPYMSYFLHKDFLIRTKKFFKIVWEKKGDIPISQLFGGLPSYVKKMYKFTHSLIIFGGLFIILFFTSREISWYVLPWIMHILIDIPTHDETSFATPFLFPVSNFRVNGIPSTRIWFQIINYVSIIVIGYLVLF